MYDGPIYPVDPVVEIQPVITQPATQPMQQPAYSPHSDELNTLAIYAIPTVAIVAIIFMMGSMSNRK
jgi:ABC-type cobalt transport system substrate-binding protein